MAEFSAQANGVTLAGDDAGEGTPVVLLHGLTATRRYVVMGSKALERDGHRVVAYDARGHGASSPAPAADDYGYGALAADLLAVLDDRGIDRALLAGASMGAHTLVRFALDHGDRVAGLVVITPAYEPGDDDDPARLERWDRLSDGLREGGVEGFVEAYGEPKVPEQWRETVFKVLRQRLALHEHPDALADALRATPRSEPFERWEELAELDAPGRRGGEPRRGRPGAPVRRRRALRRGDPGRGARLGGARLVAPGVAGQPPVEGDRGVERQALTFSSSCHLR